MSHLQYVFLIWVSFEVSPIKTCFAAKSTNSEAQNAKIFQIKISNVFKLWASFSNRMLNMSAKLQWIILSRSWEKLKREKKKDNNTTHQHHHPQSGVSYRAAVAAKKEQEQTLFFFYILHSYVYMISAT